MFNSSLSFLLALSLGVLVAHVHSQGFVIYITPNIPMINCTIGVNSSGTDIINSSPTVDASGYEVAVISAMTIQAGWDSSQWVLVCVDWDTMTNATWNSIPLFSAGGIPITSANMNKGYQYSLPVFNSGLQLVASTIPKDNLWSFLASFETSLWILILGTTVVTGIFAFIFEEQTLSCRNRNSCLKNLKEMLWQSFSSLFFASEIRLQKFSARIMFLCFWFMVLVLSATYTADLTNELASSTPTAKFQSLTQAASGNYLIETYSTYQSQLASYNLKNASLLPWGPTYAAQIFSDFLSGAIDGFVVDAPTANLFTSEWPCITYSPSDYLTNYNYGFLFPPTANYTFIQAINLYLFTFKEGDDVQNYENKYITVAPLDNSCNQSATNLELSQLAGLWVILGGSLVVSLILHLINDIIIKGDKKLTLLLSKRRKINYTKEERKFILESYPMVGDFIHIPSKDLHQQVEKDIKDGLDDVENLIRERFLNAEKRVLMTLRKINKSITQNETESLDMNRSSFMFDEGVSELQASEKFSTARDSYKEKLD